VKGWTVFVRQRTLFGRLRTEIVTAGVEIVIDVLLSGRFLCG
jgi:hypothetical protein